MKMNKGLVFALLFLLPACGFSPVYGSKGGQSGAVAEALSSVFIQTIEGRDGQFLRNKLIDRLYIKGRPAHPQATLSLSIKAEESDIGIQKDATASRSEVTIYVTYTLAAQEGAQLLSGTARSTVGYGKIDAQYGNVAGRRSAYERALTDASEQIVNRLSLYYANKAEADSGQAP